MNTPPSSSARQAQEALGARFREIRKDAGLSARALAATTGQHFTRVSKIEHGVQAPSDRDIRDWCRACGAEEQVPDLIATVRAVQSAYLEYRRQARSGMKRVLGAHTVPLYERISLFRIYEHNVIPGLLQTAAYCSAMLSFWIDFLDVPDDLNAAVAARMERQRVLYDAGKRFAVVLEEQALRTWFGTAEVQAGQLGRLLEAMSIPTVSLGIIPMMTERGAVPSAGFWIFDDSLVALETPTASIEVTRPQEIELYARMFERLNAAAVYGAAARALIIRVLSELKLAQQVATPWTVYLRPPTIAGMCNPEADNRSEQRPAASASAAGGGAASRPSDLLGCGQYADPARRPELRASALRWRRAFRAMMLRSACCGAGWNACCHHARHATIS